MTEKELRPIVVNWLNDCGYEVAHECFNFNNCDLIGFEFEKQSNRNIPDIKRIIAIELKIRDIKGVLIQCQRHRYNANQVYAAIPKTICEKMSFENRLKFHEQGIGLLSVDDDVCIKIRSLNYLVDLNRYKKSLWRWHKRLLTKGN